MPMPGEKNPANNSVTRKRRWPQNQETQERLPPPFQLAQCCADRAAPTIARHLLIVRYDLWKASRDQKLPTRGSFLPSPSHPSKKDSGGSPLPLGGRFPPATSTRPNRNTKTFVEPESDKTAGGLSDSSSCALFVSCRLNRGRQQPRPEASEPRAPVQAGREQRPVSGWVLVEASEGLRRAWPLQESDLSYP